MVFTVWNALWCCGCFVMYNLWQHHDLVRRCMGWMRLFVEVYEKMILSTRPVCIGALLGFSGVMCNSLMWHGLNPVDEVHCLEWSLVLWMFCYLSAVATLWCSLKMHVVNAFIYGDLWEANLLRRSVCIWAFLSFAVDGWDPKSQLFWRNNNASSSLRLMDMNMSTT